MFVDAIDEQMYDEHHGSGLCYLSLNKVNYFTIIVIFGCVKLHELFIKF